MASSLPIGIPSALAAVGDDLLIATAKGQSTGPDNGISELKQERRRREHPYIPTLMYGSLSRLNFRNAEKDLQAHPAGQREQSLSLPIPARSSFGRDPIRFAT